MQIVSRETSKTDNEGWWPKSGEGWSQGGNAGLAHGVPEVPDSQLGSLGGAWWGRLKEQKDTAA